MNRWALAAALLLVVVTMSPPASAQSNDFDLDEVYQWPLIPVNLALIGSTVAPLVGVGNAIRRGHRPSVAWETSGAVAGAVNIGMGLLYAGIIIQDQVEGEGSLLAGMLATAHLVMGAVATFMTIGAATLPEAPPKPRRPDDPLNGLDPDPPAAVSLGMAPLVGATGRDWTVGASFAVVGF